MKGPQSHKGSDHIVMTVHIDKNEFQDSEHEIRFERKEKMKVPRQEENSEMDYC